MSQVQHDLPQPWRESDVAQVLRALRRSGPRPIGELLADSGLAGWSAERLEHALVSAWSRNLISIDPRDLLVAL